MPSMKHIKDWGKWKICRVAQLVWKCFYFATHEHIMTTLRNSSFLTVSIKTSSGQSQLPIYRDITDKSPSDDSVFKSSYYRNQSEMKQEYLFFVIFFFSSDLNLELYLCILTTGKLFLSLFLTPILSLWYLYLYLYPYPYLSLSMHANMHRSPRIQFRLK